MVPAPAPVSISPIARVATSPRLMSLDALRGFDMVWIAGGDALAGAFRKLDAGGFATFVAWQADHSEWEGFTFYDFIFPLFLFMVGISITFSLGRIVAEGGRGPALARIFRRTVILYLLGLLYYGGFSTPVAQFRLLGVLQRIALCYGATSVLFLYLRPRTLIAVFFTLLVGYWALLMFVPVPVFGAGDLAEGHNLANWIDAHFLPLRKRHVDHDPEGLLSTLPAIASCLLGVFAGLLLRDATRTGRNKVAWLAGAGAAMLVAGLLWSVEFPIIKKLWTSSYVLVAGGCSAMLLAAFHLVIDVWQYRRWAMPFMWVGTNALTIYLLSHFVDFRALSAHLVGGDIAAWFNLGMPGLGGVVQAFVGIVLAILLCRFLYQRRIFLRL